ncbi:MAG: glycosyltransferase family 39 protein [Flavobacteriales bacterium]|nr:glycosyltransferase family 39 protein [Flavobacteriales bacterium]
MLPALGTTKVIGLPARSWVTLAVLLIALVHLALRLYMVPQYRTELGGVEHNSVHAIQKLLLDIPLYQDPEQVPFDVIQYTPAYFIACATVGKVVGISGEDARSVFLLSRIIALSLTLLTCWVVYRICKENGAETWSTALATGLVFCSYTEHFYARPDALQSFASLTAVLFFTRWLRAPNWRILTLCASFAVFGFFAKQSGALMIGVPALYLVLTGNWKAFGLYSAATLFFLLIGFVLILLGTTPWALWQNTVQGLANGYSTMMWGELFEPATYKYFIGWHILALVLLVQGFRGNGPVLHFFALAVPLAVAFGLLTGLKSGSRLNYLHEGLTLTFVGTAILLGTGKPFRWKNFTGWAFACYGLIFMAFRTKSTENWAHFDDPDSARVAEYQADIAVRDVLLNELDLEPNEHIFVTYRDYLDHFLVQQSVMKQHDIVKFSTDRLYDYAAFHKAMRDGTVRFVVTDHPEYPITFLDSTYTGWVPVRSVAGRTILARDE